MISMQISKPEVPRADTLKIYRTTTASVGSQQTSTAAPTATATMSGTATVLSDYLFPTSVSWGYPHLEVFALSDGDVPYWKWKNSSSSDPWNPQGNSLESLNGQTAAFENGLAAIARGFGIVDIFCAGTDYALYHKYHSEDLQWGTQPQRLGRPWRRSH